MVFPLVMAGAAVVGAGLQAYGTYSSYKASKQSAQASALAAAASQQIAGYELQIEGQKMYAMELDARRRSREVIRAQQRAAALGLVAATGQGAGRGSGLQGGYGQISGQTGTNLLGIYQNLDIGRNIFGLNTLISNQKQVIAGAQAQGAQAQSASVLGSGLASLGGSIMSSASSLQNISGGFGSSRPVPISSATSTNIGPPSQFSYTGSLY